MYSKFVRAMFHLRHSDEGAAYVEYVVLSALAVLAILISIQVFFGAISTLFSRLAQMLSTL